MVPHLDTVATVRSLEHDLALRHVGHRRRNSAPRAVFLPLVCLLALATGGALILVAAITMPASGHAADRALSPIRSSAEAIVTVRAFYAAVNDALRTGDAASVEALLASGLVEHAERPGLPPGRDGFLQYLDALRAAYPSVHVEVEEVLAEGDLVSVRVTARASSSNSLSLGNGAQDDVWTGVDVLRVVDGQVTERWSGSDAPTLIQPLARLLLDRWPPAASITAAARLTITPRQALRGAAFPGPGLMLVEAGALAVRGTGAEQIFRGSGGASAEPPIPLGSGIEVVLGRGDVVAFPSGTDSLSLRNEGTEPAVALAVAWFSSTDNQEAPAGGPAGESGQPGTTTTMRSAGEGTVAMLPVMDGGRVLDAPGITVTPLGSPERMRAAQLSPGRVMVTLERVMVAQGASLPPLPAAGPVLLTVEEGSLGLIPIGELAWVRSPAARQEAVIPGSEAVLSGGDTAFWDAGAVALLRGGETAGVGLLLAIRPAEGGEATS